MSVTLKSEFALIMVLAYRDGGLTCCLVDSERREALTRENTVHLLQVSTPDISLAFCR